MSRWCAALIVTTLSELGYQTLQAQDGPSGLEVLQSRVTLIAVDPMWGCPGSTGRQVADAARHAPPRAQGGCS